MTDISDNPQKIQVEGTTTRAPVSESTAQALGGSINYLLNHIFGVGDICPSMQNEATFQAHHGTGWILADGRAVPASTYASEIGPDVPDLRGMFLRGKNNARADGHQNPDVVVTRLSYGSGATTITGFDAVTSILFPKAIDEIQIGQLVTGTNIPAGTKVVSKTTNSIDISNPTTGAGVNVSVTFSGELDLGLFQDSLAHPHGHNFVYGTSGIGSRSFVATSPVGNNVFPGAVVELTSSEGRPKNVTVNYFIRIN